MPSIRIGLSTQFNLESEQVGIGTTNPTEFLDILGGIKAEGVAGGGGISTFREYQGFQQTQQGIANNIVIDNGTSGPFSSFAGEILITDETTISSGSTVEVGKTKTLTVTDRFAVPLGETNNRDNAPEPGTTRFNQDFGTLEFFDGVSWKTVNSYARYGAAGRAVFAGGYSPTSGAAGSFASVMDYVNISTKGNAVNFGEMHAGTYAALFGFSSATRGVFGGGYKNSTSTATNNDVAYITIASEGNTIDFGNLNHNQNWGKAAHASSTRGLAMGGYGTNNVIDYVEINTTGNFLDFGDLADAEFGAAGMGSPTRALTVGGGPDGIISAITIASKGNAVEWGRTDIKPSLYYAGGGSNSVRGLFNKTRKSTTQVHSIIIASYGSVENFGNLISTINNEFPGGNGNCASQTTLLFAGGGKSTNAINTIETISITTAGNATDFGDLTTKRGYMGACSDSHGGLGGF